MGATNDPSSDATFTTWPERGPSAARACTGTPPHQQRRGHRVDVERLHDLLGRRPLQRERPRRARAQVDGLPERQLRSRHEERARAPPSSSPSSSPFFPPSVPRPANGTVAAVIVIAAGEERKGAGQADDSAGDGSARRTARGTPAAGGRSVRGVVDEQVQGRRPSRSGPASNASTNASTDAGRDRSSRTIHRAAAHDAKSSSAAYRSRAARGKRVVATTAAAPPRSSRSATARPIWRARRSRRRSTRGRPAAAPAPGPRAGGSAQKRSAARSEGRTPPRRARPARADVADRDAMAAGCHAACAASSVAGASNAGGSRSRAIMSATDA